MTSPIERYRKQVREVLELETDPRGVPDQLLIYENDKVVEGMDFRDTLIGLEAAALTLARELGLAAIGENAPLLDVHNVADRVMTIAENALRKDQRTTLTELTEGGKL